MARKCLRKGISPRPLVLYRRFGPRLKARLFSDRNGICPSGRRCSADHNHSDFADFALNYTAVFAWWRDLQSFSSKGSTIDIGVATSHDQRILVHPERERHGPAVSARVILWAEETDPL